MFLQKLKTMTTFNLALQQEQDQRLEQDRVAFEYKIEADSFAAIRAEAYSCGLCGEFPLDPNSPIYFKAWCHGFEQYAIATKGEEDRLAWENVPF